MKPHHYTTALTIAGSDSGGGAGIQADLKTFSALGCYGMSVITAVTAQNTRQVTGIQELEPDFVEKQIRAVLDDIHVDAVKIGMLSSADIVRRVASCLKDYPSKPLVLDTVMVAKSGDKLLKDDAIAAMTEALFPLTTVITPNVAETFELTGIRIDSSDSLHEAAGRLLNMGAGHVLIKGGHMEGDEANDYLFSHDNDGLEVETFHGRQINTANKHGTGCTYASAITACLAKGYNLQKAVAMAKDYINHAIEAGAAYELGKGHGPVHHFYKIWST